MLSPAEIAGRLGGRPSSPGKWTARCPAHDDRKPSLSISEGENGRLLLYCHAGCDFEAILDAMDLNTDNGNGTAISVTPKSREPSREPKPRATDKSSAIYDYTDEAGQILYQVLRYEDGKGKTFKCRRPDNSGNWIWDLKGIKRILYRLPEVLKASTVFILEGEKDCDALTALGYTATTCPTGAGKWTAEYGESLGGKGILIIPDNDEPGRKHALDVASSLWGIASSVKVIELPDLPEKGDVSDFIKVKGSVAADAELARLISEAPEWKPESGATRHILDKAM